MSIVNFGIYRLFILLFSMISMCGSLPSELLTGLHNQSNMKSYTFDGEMNLNLEFEKGFYNEITDKSIRDIPIDFAVEFAGKTKYDKDKLLQSQCKLDFNIMDLKFSSDVFIDFDKENKSNKTVLIKMPRFLMISMGLGHMDVDYIEYNMETLARLLDQEGLLNGNLENEESLDQDKIDKSIVDMFQVLGKCFEGRKIIQDKGYLVVERKGKKETLRKVEITLNKEDIKVMLNNLIEDKEKLEKALDFMLMTQLDEDRKAIKDNFLSDYLDIKEELGAGIDDLFEFLKKGEIELILGIKNGYIVYQKHEIDIEIKDLIDVKYDFEINLYDINKYFKLDIPDRDKIKSLDIFHYLLGDTLVMKDQEKNDLNKSVEKQ